MNKEKQEKVAIFRFGVIFPLIEKDLREHWGEKERILRELVDKEWEIPFSKKTYISRATILNWIKRYEDGGRKIEALYPQGRGDKGRMRSLSDEQIDGLIRLRNENPLFVYPEACGKGPQRRCVSSTKRSVHGKHLPAVKSQKGKTPDSPTGHAEV